VSSATGIAREQEKLAAIIDSVDSRPLTDAAPGGSKIGLGGLFAMSDCLVVVASGFVAYSVRQMLGDFWGGAPVNAGNLNHARLLVFLIIYAGLTVICNTAQDLYSDVVIHSADAARSKLTKAFLLSSLLAVMVMFVAGEKAVPRLIFATTAGFSLAGLVTMRYLVQLRNLKRIARGVGTRHVLIVGAGKIGKAFHRYLRTHRYLGKKVCGFVDDTPRKSPLWLGTTADLPRLVKEHFIDEVYFTPGVSRDLVIDLARQARQERISVKVVPDLYGGLALGSQLTCIGDIPVLELNRQPIPATGLLAKRVIDLATAGFLTIVTAPLMLVTAIAIKLDSDGPVFYSAWRVGRKGRKFLCYKFRTMVADADARKDELRHLNERNGATFKIANDPRITRFGRVLRKFSIDELPQLFNVLKGDMSMVGPRPHPEDDFDQYRLEDLRRLDVLPGITGLWQVSARRDPSFETNVMLDLEYINNWSLSLDIKILLKTIPAVLRAEGN
jgi:exopolysaccharide biosynthesis polyprenyl glycosylphosphotransferase